MTVYRVINTYVEFFPVIESNSQQFLPMITFNESAKLKTLDQVVSYFLRYSLPHPPFKKYAYEVRTG